MNVSFRPALLAAALFAASLAQAQVKPTAPAAPAAAARPAASAAAQPGVKADPEKEAAGKLAALAWLNQLDRKDWGTAWDNSSSVFRQTVPLANWMDGIPKVRDPFGVLVMRVPEETVYKTTLPGRPNGHYVSTKFASKFEKSEIDEIVTTMLDTDGRWRVTGYSYNPR